jgi:hypothetical protein
MNNFYVYVYLDTRKRGDFVYKNLSFMYEPFYVGKGSNGRLYKHLDEAYNQRDDNDHKCNVIRKIKKETKKDPLVVKIFENLKEEESFVLEEETIKIIGRHDLKTGPLTNKTSGGEGWSGFIMSKESREKMKTSLRVYYQHHKNPFAGKKHTRKTRIKMSKPKIFKNGNPRIGVPLSDELKKKISINTKNSSKYQTFHKNSLTKYLVVSPHNETYDLIGQNQLFDWCKDKKLSFYALLNYIEFEVPTFRIGHGFKTEERVNTNGWKLTAKN